MAKEIKKPPKKKSLIYKIVYLIVLVVALSAFGFFLIRYLQVNHNYKEAIMTQEQRNQRTITAVGKIMDLPKDETPVIFQVQDKDKLGNSSVTKQFFEKAKNGDVILAYQKANMSIIYRPGEKRIVKTDNYTNFLAAANPIKIAIIAPTSQQSDTEKSITEKVLNVDIVAKNEAKVSEIQSYVADATGQNATAAKELAAKLNLPVGQLPDGELKPEGASLIVVIAQPQTQ
jgi:hypothetical protein